MGLLVMNDGMLNGKRRTGNNNSPLGIGENFVFHKRRDKEQLDSFLKSNLVSIVCFAVIALNIRQYLHFHLLGLELPNPPRDPPPNYSFVRHY